MHSNSAVVAFTVLQNYEQYLLVFSMSAFIATEYDCFA